MSRGSRVRIRAGELQHELKIQTVSNASDGQGGLTETWTTQATVYGRVAPIRSEEAYFAGQENAGLTHEVTLRYNSNIAPHARILFGSRVLNIFSLRNIDERNIKMIALCEEEV